MNLIRILLIFFLGCTQINGFGQSVPMIPFSFDADLRVLNLEHKLGTNHSLTLKPIVLGLKYSTDSLYQDIALKDEKPFRELHADFFKGHGKIALLPFRSITKHTSHHPFGWSDGSLMSVNGLQQYINAGFYAKLGPLTIQLAPELLYAQNTKYDFNDWWGDKNPIPNQRKILPGQSKVALNINAFSAGISTENIWWGAGQFTSLMMTNNAGGFPHLTFNSNRPFKTFAGKFEWQVIGGILDDNDDKPNEIWDGRSFNEFYPIKRTDGDYKKYINGINVAFTPKFLSTLTVGFNRVFISGYEGLKNRLVPTIGAFRSYLPIFDGVFKEERNSFEDSLQWNQLISFYARLELKKINAEIYAEYGWNDHKFNVRDFMMSLNHSAAFLIGFKKLVKLTPQKTLDLSVEYNQLSQSPDYLVRDAGTWYPHTYLGDMTHQGQTLGAGVGLGADVFTLSGIVRKGYDQIGVKFERINRLPLRFPDNWNDYALGIIMRKKYKNLLINLNLTGVHSNGFTWEKSAQRFNLVSMMGLTYFW